MSQPALQATGSAPAEPVPVAFLGRTSTLLLQDPAASLRRQAREVQDKLPPGWFISAWFWDIESGGLDLEQRGHGTAHQAVNTGLPRDGGLAALLAEAAGPAPRFAAVMCEDIERSGRDTFNALKLERQLGDAGIPLFATDEPNQRRGHERHHDLDPAGEARDRGVVPVSTERESLARVRAAHHRRVQHRRRPLRVRPRPHPSPQPRQGRPRQDEDPPRHRSAARAPVVEQIFAWRTADKLGVTTITNRLNAEPGRYPSPKPGGWTAGGVYAILRNPKYTGHMVYGRRRSTGRRRFHDVPQEQWIWSPEQTHPAIITRQTWDTAQGIGAEHASARDDAEPSTHPAARRSYLLRSRARCRDCKRRMRGTLVRPYAGHPGYVYYTCPHNLANPRHQAAVPDHPRTVRVREDDLLTVIRQFFAAHVFGPDRAAMLAERLPASAAEDTTRREQETASCTSGSRRSTPPRTPTPAKSKTSPACPQAPPRSPRCGPGSSHGSANWRPSGPRSTTGSPA